MPVSNVNYTAGMSAADFENLKRKPQAYRKNTSAIAASSIKRNNTKDEFSTEAKVAGAGLALIGTGVALAKGHGKGILKPSAEAESIVNKWIRRPLNSAGETISKTWNKVFSNADEAVEKEGKKAADEAVKSQEGAAAATETKVENIVTSEAAATEAKAENVVTSEAAGAKADIKMIESPSVQLRREYRNLKSELTEARKKGEDTQDIQSRVLEAKENLKAAHQLETQSSERAVETQKLNVAQEQFLNETDPQKKMEAMKTLSDLQKSTKTKTGKNVESSNADAAKPVTKGETVSTEGATKGKGNPAPVVQETKTGTSDNPDSFDLGDFIGGDK